MLGLQFQYTVWVVLLHVALTLMVCLTLYLLIFHVAWKQLQQSQSLIISPKAAAIHKEAKTAKMMGLILGVHMVSLIPYLVVVTMRYLDEGNGSTQAGPLSDAKKVRK